MFLFNKGDVYIGYSLDEVSKIVNILNEKNIKYTHKILKYLCHDEKYSFKRVGLNMDYEAQYTISVNSNDFEDAKYYINTALNP